MTWTNFKCPVYYFGSLFVSMTKRVFIEKLTEGEET